jgi:uncharacterized protein YjiS (DUF1127 family)
MNMGRSLIADRSSAAPARGHTASAKALLFNSVKRLASWIGSECSMCRGVAELRAMDNRLLADIGLTRERVEYLARYGTLPRKWGDHP